MPFIDELFPHLLLRPPCTCSAITNIHPSSFTASSSTNSSNSNLHSVDSIQSHPTLPSLSSSFSTKYDTYHDATTQHLLSSFPPHRYPISTLAFSLDGNHLYTVAGGKVCIWDVPNSLSQLDAFNLSEDGADKFLYFSNDGDGNVYTTHQDRWICVWQPERMNDVSGA